MADIQLFGRQVRDPRKTLPRGLVLGVAWRNRRLHVVNFVYVRALRTCRTGSTMTPASSVDAHVTRPARRLLIAAGNCVFLIWIPRPIDVDSSTRLFRDGRGPHLFQRRGVDRPTDTRAVVAILLQGVWAIVIALTGTYAQVVNYVVAMDSCSLA